jgi:NADPH:quinone reductase-like Zn-dependent oxidoreductase
LPPAHKEVPVSKAASGKLTVPTGAELPLSQAAEAQRRLEARGIAGEMVLNTWSIVSAA